jgi:hypothetical protein
MVLVPCILGTPRTRLKSSPTTSDLLPGMGGLRCHHVSRDIGPASRWGRALMSSYVPRFQTRLLVREGSGVVACPVAPGQPSDRGGLRCHHVSHGFRPASQCGRALTSSLATWLSVLWATSKKEILSWSTYSTGPTYLQGVPMRSWNVWHQAHHDLVSHAE